ncbi:uncharacterized protein zc3h3 isoform X1 [Polypterus senegalus]|uniref:uncharacterized protein zc3h3 isoform X1 n=1 Tax=Polypterus senegalus TaxID=55291 RepID=UPI001963C481|nr:uncharacterized protein zc3h3 isoform X1 [Polypterus senegalus]
MLFMNLEMEEKAALKRQIELLENLISKHKNVHGNAPSPSFSNTGSRHMLRESPVPGLHASSGFRGSRVNPHCVRPATQWKNKYSLNNQQLKLIRSTGALSSSTATVSSSSGLLQHNAQSAKPNASRQISRFQQKAASGKFVELSPSFSEMGNASTSSAYNAPISGKYSDFILEQNLSQFTGLQKHKGSDTTNCITACSGLVPNVNKTLIPQRSVLLSKDKVHCLFVAEQERLQTVSRSLTSNVSSTCSDSVTLNVKRKVTEEENDSVKPKGHIITQSAKLTPSLHSKTCSLSLMGFPPTEQQRSALQPNSENKLQLVGKATQKTEQVAPVSVLHSKKSGGLASYSPDPLSKQKIKRKTDSRQLEFPGVSQNVLQSALNVKKSRYTWVKTPKSEQTTAIEGGVCTVQSDVKAGLVVHRPQLMMNVSPFKRRAVCSPKGLKKVSSLQLSPLCSFKSTKAKYTWTCASPRSSKPAKKCFSPKYIENGGSMKSPGNKLKSYSFFGAKPKKLPTPPEPLVSRSKYQWKAAVSSPSSSVANSVYSWKKDKKRESLTHVSVYSSPSVYKVKSRMKIIRRKSCSSSQADKNNHNVFLTPKTKFPQQRHGLLPVKVSPLVKKSPARVLVPIGRHKLRCLSTMLNYYNTKSGPLAQSSKHSPSNRSIRTRYKIVKRSTVGASSALYSTPVLTWRAQKVISARLFLQNRMRKSSAGYRQSPYHLWKERGTRWIGGALYKVSANKLFKASNFNTKNISYAARVNSRAGKWTSSNCLSSLNKTSNSRQVASRAVQRSLAIIRQARLKKQQKKEYCMYYNRFGKCNRGASCPFIHDPDKVAVCTRFLRGTCKQTDGTCPFSHKVSKDKMPVCSYFLKGICSNNSCPYSHVYVSRKAEVCIDFVKGYCPLGEKCKKKHTLLCPDFAKSGTCPKGNKCKLQHRQQQNRPRTQELGVRNKQAENQLQQKSTEGVSQKPETEIRLQENEHCQPQLEKLPSYIALNSSPSTPETEDKFSLTVIEGSEGIENAVHALCGPS